MSRKILILQHLEWAGPGRLLLDSLPGLHTRFHVVRLWEQAAPDPADYDALILLGGPLDPASSSMRSLLREERRLVQAWLSLDRPCLGFNLGHLMLADAFKASIGANFVSGVGFREGHLTHAGRMHPVFHEIDTPLLLFKWHDQAIQTPVPADMVPLATSSHCVVEAFSIRGRPAIIGLQCDNYAAHPDDVTRWLAGGRSIPPVPVPDSIAAGQLVDEARHHLPKTMETFTKLIKNFITLTDRTRRTDIP